MRLVVLLAVVSGVIVATGCSENAPVPVTDASPTPTVDGSQYRLQEEPEDAKGVIDVREAAEEGERVLVVGRIGGSSNPWIDGRAAFTIVDPSLQACSDIPGDQCQKPWDYCCETPKLPTATALVKLVDQDGELLKTDARELLDVEELSTVVVEGKAERDDSGNLTVLASGVYVRS